MHNEILSREQIELLPLVIQFKREFYLVGGTAINVKFTFYEYPFPIQPSVNFDDTIRIPSLLDLAAMKAYAFGRLAKWKDYVDMYFLLRDHFSLEQIMKRAVEIYDQLFSSKLFRAQLSYYEEIDFSEPVEFLISAPPEEEIKQFLVDKALDISL